MASYTEPLNARYELSRKDKTYVDISLAFQPSPLTDDITVLTNERAINNSLKNIVLFMPGEVPFNHDIGSTTQRYLFDLADEGMATLLSMEIERACLFCEPRITFDPIDPYLLNTSDYAQSKPSTQRDLIIQDDLGVQVTADIDANSFEVTIVYRIIGGEEVYRYQTILTPTR